MEVEIKRIRLPNRRLSTTRKIIDKYSKEIFYDGILLDYFLQLCTNNSKNKWNSLIFTLFKFGSERNIATHLHLAKFVPSAALIMFALENTHTDVGTQYLYDNFRENFYIVQKIACLSHDIPEIQVDCLISHSIRPLNSLWMVFAGEYFRGKIELLNRMQEKYPEIITQVIRRAIDCEVKKLDNLLWMKILTVPV